MASSYQSEEFRAERTESRGLLRNLNQIETASFELDSDLNPSAVYTTPYRSLTIFGIAMMVAISVIVFTTGKLNISEHVSNTNSRIDNSFEVSASLGSGKNDDENKILLWVLGGSGKSCDDTCDNIDGECNEGSLKLIKRAPDLRNAFPNSIGKVFDLNCNTNVAPYLKANTYYYCNTASKLAKMKCEKKVSGVQRVCPCKIEPTDPPTLEPTTEPTVEPTTEPTVEPTAEPMP
mmetsp:Transcript_1584/g.1659  ORF Transcript_1584/g.1659 Transcript_1584/m.1659 type:complete len:234 (+) Transcript_1584:115-816(+)